MSDTHVQCEAVNFSLGQGLKAINVNSSEHVIELLFEDFKLTLMSDTGITGIISDLNGAFNE